MAVKKNNNNNNPPPQKKKNKLQKQHTHKKTPRNPHVGREWRTLVCLRKGEKLVQWPYVGTELI